MRYEEISAMPSDTGIMQAAQAGTFTLGGDLTVNRMGYGAMRLTGKGIWGPPADHDGAIATLRRAVELGVNFIDTADSYGPDVNEELIAEALHPYPKDLVITTKVGWTRHGPGVWQHNASPAHIQQAIEGSLKRLRLERIDVYQLHIPDPAASFDASMQALAQLQQQGKVRHIALSNVTLEHIKRAQRIVPIVSVQNRYSFSDREWDFVVDYCEEQKIAFLPWGPMAQARKANEVVEKLAAARNVSTAVVSLAWLLRRSPVMVPIPGTSSIKHLEENVGAASFKLSDTEFAEMNAVVPKPYWLR
jgi:aryl-alcohol dehydrogenase-like predicted oxidoreductase